jgi:multiple sugar transport system substrate-binding protein
MKRKRLFSLLLALVLTLGLTACGENQTSEEQGATNQKSGEATTEEITTIEVWTQDRHDSEYVQAKIEEYNETNTDGILISLNVVTDDYENMLALAYAGGTAPDIASTPVALNTFADTGMIIPLNEYIDSDETYQKVNAPYKNAYEGLNSKDGNIYYVYSGMRSGVRVQYNKTLLEEAGYTEIPEKLEDYIEMAKDITVKGSGETFGIGFTSSSPFERLLEMSAQVSGVYYYDYVNGRYDFSGYKDILELGQRFISEDIAYPDQQGVDNMRALFAQGEFALWSNASQEAGVFTSQIPITDFEWGVGTVPSLTGEVNGALQTNPSKAYAIFSSSEHKDKAWKVIQYFQSEEFIKGYLEEGYSLPITQYMDGVIDKTKIGRLADFSLLEYESVYPTPPTVNLTGDNYRILLWNAVMGHIGIDEAIEDLNKRYNDALDADVASGAVKRLVISDYDPLNPSEGTATYLTE